MKPQDLVFILIGTQHIDKTKLLRLNIKWRPIYVCSDELSLCSSLPVSRQVINMVFSFFSQAFSSATVNDNIIAIFKTKDKAQMYELYGDLSTAGVDTSFFDTSLPCAIGFVRITNMPDHDQTTPPHESKELFSLQSESQQLQDTTLTSLDSDFTHTMFSKDMSQPDENSHSHNESGGDSSGGDVDEKEEASEDHHTSLPSASVVVRTAFSSSSEDDQANAPDAPSVMFCFSQEETTNLDIDNLHKNARSFGSTIQHSSLIRVEHWPLLSTAVSLCSPEYSLPNYRNHNHHASSISTGVRSKSPTISAVALQCHSEALAEEIKKMKAQIAIKENKRVSKAENMEDDCNNSSSSEFRGTQLKKSMQQLRERALRSVLHARRDLKLVSSVKEDQRECGVLEETGKCDASCEISSSTLDSSICGTPSVSTRESVVTASVVESRESNDKDYKDDSLLPPVDENHSPLDNKDQRFSEGLEAVRELNNGVSNISTMISPVEIYDKYVKEQLSICASDGFAFSYLCYCGSVFPSLEAVLAHMKHMNHGAKPVGTHCCGQFTCGCGLRCSSLVALYAHMKERDHRHASFKSFPNWHLWSCPIRGQGQDCEPDVISCTIPCPKCYKLFPSYGPALLHMILTCHCFFDSDLATWIRCGTCELCFPTVFEYYEHLQDSGHKFERTALPSAQDSRIRNQLLKKPILKIDTPYDSVQFRGLYRCLCGVIFANLFHVPMHAKRCHYFAVVKAEEVQVGKLDGFKCSCEKQFKSLYSYYQHLSDSAHVPHADSFLYRGQFPPAVYNCQCGSADIHISDVVTHAKSCTQNCNLICVRCGHKTLTSLDDAYTHVHSDTHSDWHSFTYFRDPPSFLITNPVPRSWLHRCCDCEFGANTISDLVAHMRIRMHGMHKRSGVEHKCSCRCTFSCRWLLYEHIVAFEHRCPHTVEAVEGSPTVLNSHRESNLSATQRVSCVCGVSSLALVDAIHHLFSTRHGNLAPFVRVSCSCGQDFSDLLSLYIHLFDSEHTFHSSSSRFMLSIARKRQRCCCDDCGQSFPTATDAIDHCMKMSHGQRKLSASSRRFTCSCGSFYTQLIDLLRHMFHSNHTEVSESSFPKAMLSVHQYVLPCTDCDAQFNTVDDAVKHLESTQHGYVNFSNNPFACECSYRSTTMHGLYKHMSVEGHYSLPPLSCCWFKFQCCDCEQSFATPTIASEHMVLRKHGMKMQSSLHGKNEQSITCDCGFKASCLWVLYLHKMKSKDIGRCKSSYPRILTAKHCAGDINYHATEMGRMSYSCTCKAVFPTLMSVLHHMYQHEHESTCCDQQVICSDCGAVFQTRREYYFHLFNVQHVNHVEGVYVSSSSSMHNTTGESSPVTDRTIYVLKPVRALANGSFCNSEEKKVECVNEAAHGDSNKQLLKLEAVNEVRGMTTPDPYSVFDTDESDMDVDTTYTQTHAKVTCMDSDEGNGNTTHNSAAVNLSGDATDCLIIQEDCSDGYAQSESQDSRDHYDVFDSDSSEDNGAVGCATLREGAAGAKRAADMNVSHSTTWQSSKRRRENSASLGGERVFNCGDFMSNQERATQGSCRDATFALVVQDAGAEATVVPAPHINPSRTSRQNELHRLKLREKTLKQQLETRRIKAEIIEAEKLLAMQTRKVCCMVNIFS